MKTHSTTGYLIIKAQRNRFYTGVSYITGLNLPRFVKNKPNLSADEIAVKLTMTLPDSAFLDPQYEASIELAEQDVIQPQITVEEPNEDQG